MLRKLITLAYIRKHFPFQTYCCTKCLLFYYTCNNAMFSSYLLLFLCPIVHNQPSLFINIERIRPRRKYPLFSSCQTLPMRTFTCLQIIIQLLLKMNVGFYCSQQIESCFSTMNSISLLFSSCFLLFDKKSSLFQRAGVV